MDPFRKSPAETFPFQMDFCRCNSIQNLILEVTVLEGSRLKNTERFSRQDPYVFVKYGGNEYRTRTCTDGGTNPVFHDKFKFSLIEGLRELEIRVFNSNTFTTNDFIGEGKIPLQEVLSSGYQECSCLLTNNRKSAGEIKLTLRYPNAQKADSRFAPPSPAPQYQRHPLYLPPQANFYQAPPQYPPYPPYQHQFPPPQGTYPPPYSAPPSVYPPAPPSVYPPAPPPVYPPPPSSSYHPVESPSFSFYPPPEQSSYFPPPSPYHGVYPPPPY